jgi:hypothetical protein
MRSGQQTGIEHVYGMSTRRIRRAVRLRAVGGRAFTVALSNLRLPVVDGADIRLLGALAGR